MDVIPVIDVARGRVVRGIKGQRASYQPIETPLVAGSDPADVARALMRIHAFRKLYIADLDGIEGRGRNVHLVPAISAAVGQAELWVDAGTATRKAARAVLAAPVTTLVIGSESIETLASFRDIVAEAPERTVLSLDFRGMEFMGPPRLMSETATWPSRIIAMTLARVGSEEGPDLERLGEIIRRAGARKVYAAGGVRNSTDLKALRDAGAAGVLVASALHAGAISAADIRGVANR